MSNRLSNYFARRDKPMGGRPATSMGWGPRPDGGEYTIDEAWVILCKRAVKIGIEIAVDYDPQYHHKDARNLADALLAHAEAHPFEQDDDSNDDPFYLYGLVTNLVHDAEGGAP